LKRGAAMKSMLVSMAVVLIFYAAPAVSAEFPKTGEAEYDTYYVDNVVAKIDSGVGAGAIVDETGVTRNVKGEGPFHDMSVRCLYHRSVGITGTVSYTTRELHDAVGGRPALIAHHKAKWEIK
jgi:hypothetical protein